MTRTLRQAHNSVDGQALRDHKKPMTLDAFLTENRMTDTAFAGKIGIVPSNVGRIRRGEISPTLKLMERIARETNGAVTPNDFLPAGVISCIEQVSA